ncbi:Thiamine pyrophosphokinase [Pleurostoma richardsiae]|uniref:Thiamine pyrophosphokinase n=1 Tax=Pleurostoma richardsiae TaxID=41990 RepID=A0AA38RDF2_9PEZI|nr:Thiamine pyrophosphokinase [Pleurostoma richardsiae]
MSVFEWHPARLLQGRPAAPHGGGDQFALVILNQPLRDLATLERLWQNSLYRVAADGGANRLYEVIQQANESLFGRLDLIIGDLDSLSDEARSYYADDSRPAKIVHDPDQYSTDFSKAVSYIRSSRPGPVDIIAMGGLGGRVDQGLSQLHHLYLFQQDPAYAEGRMYLVSGESLTFLLKAGKHRIHVRNGGDEVFDKYVGIIPVKEPSIITTEGLEWDVAGWQTEFGGRISTSNHVLPATKTVEVETEKDVLFTIALRK